MFREQNGEIGMHKDFVCFSALTVRKLNESLQNYSVMKTFFLKIPTKYRTVPTCKYIFCF